MFKLNAGTFEEAFDILSAEAKKISLHHDHSRVALRDIRFKIRKRAVEYMGGHPCTGRATGTVWVYEILPNGTLREIKEDAQAP